MLERLLEFLSAIPPKLRTGWLLLALVLLFGATALADGPAATPAANDPLQAQLDEASRLEQAGKQSEAVAVYLRALAEIEPLHGPKDEAKLKLLGRLAPLYVNINEAARASEVAQRGIALAVALHGTDSPQEIELTGNLAAACIMQGDYPRAAALLQRIIPNLEKRLGATHKTTIINYANLGSLYMQLGDYPQAETYLRRALAGAKPDSVVATGILDNLSSMYFLQGDYERAAPLLDHALQLSEKLRGAEHPQTGTILFNLCALHCEQGYYRQAESFCTRALALREKSLGAQNPDVAMALTNLGVVYTAQGEYARAAPLLERAVRIMEQAMGPQHPDLAYALLNQGTLEYERGDWTLAERHLQRAAAIWTAALGSQHPLLAQAQRLVAQLRTAQGRSEEALPLLRLSLDNGEARLRHEGMGMSEGRREKLLQVLVAQDALVYSLLLQKPRHAATLSLALLTTLLHKGRLVDELARTGEALSRSLGKKDQKQLAALRVLHSRYASQLLAGPGQTPLLRFEKELRELAEQADRLEQDLAGRSLPLRARQSLPTGEELISRVVATLPTDSALIEFVSFNEVDLHAPRLERSDGPAHYLALILDKSGALAAVDLGRAAPLDDEVGQLSAALADPQLAYLPAARKLYQRLLVPLLAELRGRRRLLLSPDGQLNLLPFDVLHDGQRHVVDDYHLSYLTSGRDLLQGDDTPALGDVVVLADPAFAAAPAAAPTGALSPPSDRGLRLSALAPLPGTRKEALVIAALWPKARLLLGTDASEPALLGLRAPAVLHIATHGIFLADEAPAAVAERGFAIHDTPPPKNPLLRSALVLAGAQLQQTGPAPTLGAADSADGVATALEISGMDLFGTQLVVLSACETGRGDVHRGQGIYGLRRAVRAAGAQTLVASLWRVSDQVTQELMAAYYRKLRDGQGRIAGLREAALGVRQQHPHPYYWASFIALGKDAPLRLPP